MQIIFLASTGSQLSEGLWKAIKFPRVDQALLPLLGDKFPQAPAQITERARGIQQLLSVLNNFKIMTLNFRLKRDHLPGYYLTPDHLTNGASNLTLDEIDHILDQEIPNTITRGVEIARKKSDALMVIVDAQLYAGLMFNHAKTVAKDSRTRSELDEVGRQYVQPKLDGVLKQFPDVTFVLAGKFVPAIYPLQNGKFKAFEARENLVIVDPVKKMGFPDLGTGIENEKDLANLASVVEELVKHDPAYIPGDTGGDAPHNGPVIFKDPTTKASKGTDYRGPLFPEVGLPSFFGSPPPRNGAGESSPSIGSQVANAAGHYTESLRGGHGGTHGPEIEDRHGK